MHFGSLFLFVVLAFALGFFVVPRLAREMEQRSSLDWPLYLWLLSGVAPLTLQATAFTSSLLLWRPDWAYLINAACPLGVSLALAFPVSPLESDQNLL